MSLELSGTDISYRCVSSEDIEGDIITRGEFDIGETIILANGPKVAYATVIEITQDGAKFDIYGGLREDLEKLNRVLNAYNSKELAIFNELG